MRINLLKKVVVGGLITSLCLCCFFLNFNKNVSASELNDDLYDIVYDSDFTSKFNFENYKHIEELNDLKGTMWVCNYDASYPTLSDNFETYTLSYISPYDAVQENDYLLAPFALQNPNYFMSTFFEELYPYNLKCYSFSNTRIIEFVENFPNSDLLLHFISTNFITTTLDTQQNKFVFNSNSINATDIIISCNVDVGGPVFASSQLDFYYSYFNKLQNGTDYDYWTSVSTLGMSCPYIIFFPDSNYTLEFSTTNDSVPESEFLEMFKTHFTLIEVENFSIWKNTILKDIEFDKGYDDGYEMGYNQGVYDATDTSYRFPFLTGILNAVSDVLALEIFPNVRLGYFVLIPLVLGVTGMIFWFWRKD